VALAKVRLLARDISTRNPGVLIWGHLPKAIALASTATVIMKTNVVLKVLQL
jgi:hypothetical protein